MPMEIPNTFSVGCVTDVIAATSLETGCNVCIDQERQRKKPIAAAEQLAEPREIWEKEHARISPRPAIDKQYIADDGRWDDVLC